MNSYMHFCIVTCPYCGSPPGKACGYWSKDHNRNPIWRNLKPHRGRKTLAMRQEQFIPEASEEWFKKAAGKTENL